MFHHSVFDQESFGPAFSQDLLSAKSLVIIHVPYVTRHGIERLRAPLRDCLRRGVSVCVFLLEPRNRLQSSNQHLSDDAGMKMQELQLCISALKSIGAHVSLRKLIHEKIAVIDEGILWEGSLNILSYGFTSERMNRWVDAGLVKEAISRHHLNRCSQCLDNPQFQIFSQACSIERALELIGQRLSRRRKYLGWSQRDLALKMAKTQDLICHIELGRRNVGITTPISLCRVLGLELVAVPRHLLPAILRMDSDGIGTIERG